MNVKRIIAREWLYLLGFAVFATLVAALSLIVLKPDPVENVTLADTKFSKEDGVRLRRNLDSTQCRIFDSLSVMMEGVRQAQERAAQGDTLPDLPRAWADVLEVLEAYQEMLATPRELRSGSKGSAEYEKYTTWLAKQYLGAYLTSPEGRSMLERVVAGCDSLYRIAVNSATAKYETRQRYERKTATLKSVAYYAAIFPYPAFLLLRSIIWAVGLVKRRASR